MENTFSPMVSIVIPVYNGSDYVAQAIDSALAQTYDNFEVIVVNDGSNDNGATAEVVKSYGERVRYFEKPNGGVSSALNFGIKQMRGDYFSWLSHDDTYKPDKLRHSVECLRALEDRSKTIALCGLYYINDKSEKIRESQLTFETGKLYKDNDILRYVLTHTTLNMCCMLIPRRAFEDCGGFDEELRYNQDMLMFLRFFFEGYALIYVPNAMDVSYRLHAAQTSKNRRDLLVRDSATVAEMIAPEFARRSTKDCNLLKLYAKENARYDLKKAVEHCIEVGKEHHVLSSSDCLYLRIWLLLGKGRNVLKAVYHAVRFKK